jgi:hypothetical protein
MYFFSTDMNFPENSYRSEHISVSGNHVIIELPNLNILLASIKSPMWPNLSITPKHFTQFHHPYLNS